MQFTLLLDSGPLDLLWSILCALGLSVVIGIGLWLWRSGKLKEGILIVMMLSGLFFISQLWDDFWSSWKAKQRRQHTLMIQQQHRAVAFTSLSGHYFLADTMLMKTNYDSFVDTISPAPVYVHLFLRSDSTYSYRSNIPNDATLDTSGTWKVGGHQYDEHLNYEQYEVAFTPTRQPACGLRIIRENNGQVSSQGTYYHNDVNISFELIPAKKLH